MAFEQLDKCVEELEKFFNDARQKSTDAAVAGHYETHKRMDVLSEGVFHSLVIYYQTALSHGKFKSQRINAKAAITRMNPAFAEGYFKGKK